MVVFGGVRVWTLWTSCFFGEDDRFRCPGMYVVSCIMAVCIMASL